MKKRKQIKASVLAVLMVSVLSIGCSKDDDTQPQTETPTGEVDKAPEIKAQTFTAKEDIADDAIIGNIIATDPEDKALTFALTKNSDDLFELTNAGELSLVADKKLDFETVTSYTLTVEVSDGKNKVSADITITVENVVEPFVTTWKTTAANEEIIYQLNDQLTYDITIDWGDGSTDTKITSTPKHTYTEPGTYTISVSGVLPSVRFGLVERSALKISTLNAEKLQTIEAWGDNVWESMEEAFTYCKNMTYNAKDVPNLSKVTDMSGMFIGCKKFNPSSLNSWDVSTIANMNGIFSDATSFNGDISAWDVSKVTNMFGMFSNATSFNRDLNQWDVSKVTNMERMFDKATSFNSDLSQWDVSKVTNMDGMFLEATSFNKDLGTWDVSNVLTMSRMFQGATSFTQDLSIWDVSKVRNMGNMLTDTNISMANYDKLLIAWAALPNLQSNVTLGARGLEYCGGTRARNTLINDKGWTITGDSASASCT